MNEYNNGKQQDFIDKESPIMWGFLLFLLIHGLVALYSQLNPQATIKEGSIKRPYSQLLMSLDEEPADISSTRYETSIPEIVQEDIQKMLASNGDLDILYYSTNSYIRIEKDDESYSGIKFMMIAADDELLNTGEVITNISMYKSGENIVIYGSYSANRFLRRYEIGDESLEYGALNNGYIDIYGTDIHYDEIQVLGGEMSLLKNGNDFMFYRLGEQVGETEHFPGGEIVQFKYEYILDDKGDMYYLYYCGHPGNPWIKFVKVASNVADVIANSETLYLGEFGEYSRLGYPIYVKDEKKYVSVANADTERAYGPYGRKCDTQDESTIDFEIATVELTGDNASSIVIRKSLGGLLYSEYYDWYIRYNYTVKGQTLYIEKRINGLDSYLTTIIPEEELEKFNGKEVRFEEIEEVVEELKQLYDKFSSGGSEWGLHYIKR